MSTKLDPFALNRGERRRMKKALKMGKTPSREQAGKLIMDGYEKAEKVEPSRVRVARAKFSGDTDREISL